MKRAIRLFSIILFIDLIVSLIVGLICWLCGWRSSYYYGNGLFIAGAFIVVLGCLSVIGSHSTAGDLEYQNVRTTSAEGISKRFQQDLQLIAGSYHFLIVTSIAGLILIVLSVVVHRIIF